MLCISKRLDFNYLENCYLNNSYFESYLEFCNTLIFCSFTFTGFHFKSFSILCGKGSVSNLCNYTQKSKNQYEYLKDEGIGPVSTHALQYLDQSCFSYAKRQQWYFFFFAPVYMSIGACYFKNLLSLVLDNSKVGYILFSQGLINAVLSLRYTCLLFDPHIFYRSCLCILTAFKKETHIHCIDAYSL